MKYLLRYKISVNMTLELDADDMKQADEIADSLVKAGVLGIVVAPMPTSAKIESVIRPDYVFVSAA